jgi:hypothetical protein
VRQRRAHLLPEAAGVVGGLQAAVLDEEPHGRRHGVGLLEFLAVSPAGEEAEQVVVVPAHRPRFERDQDVETEPLRGEETEPREVFLLLV